MSSETQISAFISTTTKELLDEYTRATGVKKGHLIEQALRHHLEALQEIPLQYVIPAKIVLTRESGERLLDRLRHPPEPTQALKDLMRSDDDGD